MDPHIAHLYAHLSKKSIPGLDTTLKRLENPREYHATLYELQMAYWISVIRKHSISLNHCLRNGSNKDVDIFLRDKEISVEVTSFQDYKSTSLLLEELHNRFPDIDINTTTHRLKCLNSPKKLPEILHHLQQVIPSALNAGAPQSLNLCGDEITVCKGNGISFSFTDPTKEQGDLYCNIKHRYESKIQKIPNNATGFIAINTNYLQNSLLLSLKPWFDNFHAKTIPPCRLILRTNVGIVLWTQSFDENKIHKANLIYPNTRVLKCAKDVFGEIFSEMVELKS